MLRPAGTRSRNARTAAREAQAAEHIPYICQADGVTLQTRSGDLVQIFRLDGKPFETESAAELDRLKDGRNTLLRALAGGEYALWQHVVRRRVHPDLASAPPPGFARDLDTQWQARLQTQQLYVNELYLSLVRRAGDPSTALAHRLQRALSPKVDRQAAQRQHHQALRELHQQADNLMAKLAPYHPRRLGTTTSAQGLQSELLGFCLQLLTGTARPVLLPTLPLDRYLPSTTDYFGGEAFEVRSPGGSRFGAVLSIKEYAAQTFAGMLDRLFTLPGEAILTQSFAFIGRGTALEALGRQARIMESIDDPALSQIEEIEAARDDLASSRLVYGSHHLTVVPLVERAEELDQACHEIDRRLSDLGLIVVRESGGAMELARWAQLPGNFAYIARPAPISSRNFAAFASLHNDATGKPDGNHWGSAVAILETVSGTPYHFNFHDGDSGNTLVVGATGSGKTTVIAFLLAQARRLDTRIVYFDKDRGADLLIRALGGRYSVIRRGEPSGFNPLQLPDGEATQAFLADWLGLLLTARGESLNASDVLHLRRAIHDSYRLPPEQRRLAVIAAFLPRVSQSALAERLQPWHGSGPQGWVFDHEADELALDGQVMGFDLTDVLRDPVIRVPVLYYLLHRVDRILAEGHRTIIVIDEGWAALRDPVFSPLVDDWSRTLRKRGGLVIFASQSPESITQHPLGLVIVSQSPTHIFMPNPKSTAKAFEGYNLTPRELDLILSLDTESRCCLIKHGHHSVIARLDLKGMEDSVAILSGRQQTVALADAVRAKVGDDPTHWIPEFHRRRRNLA